MDKVLKLLIADDEQYICGMLRKLIHFEALGLQFIDFAFDGNDLLKKIKKYSPDIVITDISMPKVDGLEVIRRAKESGSQCRFIIASGYRQFEYAYNALKYEVEDYILKPVEQEELNNVLEKVCENIRQSKHLCEDSNTVAVQNRLFEQSVHDELKNSLLDLNSINNMYRTSFQKGLYRMIIAKIDYTLDARQTMEDMSSVLKKIETIMRTQLKNYCYDIIIAKYADGVRGLINYEENSDKIILREIYSLYTLASNVIDLFQDLHLTVCVGKGVCGLNEIAISEQSCRGAEWVRMSFGTDKVIVSDDLKEHDQSFLQLKLEELKLKLEKSFVAWDISNTIENLHEFFNLPMQVLCCTEAMLFIQKMIKEFVAVYKKTMKDPADESVISNRIFRSLNFQTTFMGYRDELCEQIRSIMENVEEAIQEKNARPIRQACMYIEQNYTEKLSLEKVANEVNLNPVYFSNLFKKETGKNFIEYLTEYRMKIARELLRNSDKNVNEIAELLGYTDARYFSKQFKKVVGVKPTDYRKIYG